MKIWRVYPHEHGPGRSHALAFFVNGEPSEKFLCGIRRSKSPGVLEDGAVSCKSCLALLGRLEKRSVESSSGTRYETYAPRSGASK